ncbi:response regulator [Rosettibacter firmus]|uniref:response regulator n=1 Tax=Rosettibacter firmus TaxID=3111522 RepID=UPI00336BD1DB
MQINILFVDDDIDILNGFKRSMYNLRDKWNGFYASNSADALKIIQHENVDVCITDLFIPGISGSELLRKVKKEYPKTIRVLLSGNPSAKYSVYDYSVAHQYLTKPCNIEIIKEKIEIPILIRSLINNEKTIIKLTGEDGIPSFPEIYYKLECEIYSPNVSINRIVNLISKDIGLTAKIFQLVNSAFFGFPTKIKDLNQAINILGLNIIKSIILFTKVFPYLEMSNALKEFIESLWNHSLVVSTISQRLTFYLTRNRELSEHAYIAGMLHDIGKLIILNMSNQDKTLLNVLDIINNENEIKKFLGATHSEIGAYALSLWGYPNSIINAVLLHHSTLELNNFNITTAVQISNRLANIEGIDFSILEKFDSIESIVELINTKEGNKDEIPGKNPIG